MQAIFERVCKWNAARYEQVYNQELSVALIEEELAEYYNEDPVEKLDALCDLVFVAMGVVWKFDSKLDSSVADSARDLVLSCVELDSIDLVYAVCSAWKTGTMLPDTAMFYIVELCRIEASLLGYTNEEFEAALLVVCDSNDTKEIKKTAPNVKANISKGVGYVAPTEGLTNIYNTMLERKNMAIYGARDE